MTVPGLKRGQGWGFWLRLALVICCLTGAWLASAAERFPPPEFEPGTYVMPGIQTPVARAAWRDWLDVVVLLGALSLSTYLVLIRRLRKHIFWLMLFSLAYFGFYRQGCVCPIGATQNVTLALCDSHYAVPLTVIVFFLAPLFFTLFFGRTFFAAVCPLGAMQDLVLWRPVKVQPWLEKALGLIPFVYLGLALLFAGMGAAFIICEYDPFVAFFRLGGSLPMLALGAGFLITGMFVGRPYCRFLCPYGAILSLLSRVSRWNVVLTPDDCVRCQICDVACPYGAIAQPAEVPAPAGSPAGRKWLWGVLALVPLLMLAGAWLGGQLSVPLSKTDRQVALAEQVAGEDVGVLHRAGDTNAPAATLSRAEVNARNASKAFRQQGGSAPQLYQAALEIRNRYRQAGYLLGAFVGLVLAVKLLNLARPEPHSIYEPDRASCLACGRCYSYCPKELVRVKKNQKKAVAPAAS
jgi:Fe-S-cluster-containing hydrogenase component 2